MNIIDLLIKHEGIRYNTYIDSVGKLTVGVGHNLDDKPLSHAAVMFILAEDIRDTVNDLEQFYWFDHLDEIRRNVCIDMCFNLGIGRFKKFSKMIEAIESGDWNKASEEMLSSKWATQVGSRAIELSNMMREGDNYDSHVS